MPACGVCQWMLCYSQLTAWASWFQPSAIQVWVPDAGVLSEPRERHVEAYWPAVARDLELQVTG